MESISDPALEALRLGNPSARSLPLLSALARGEAATIVLPLLDHQMLRVRVQPCA